MNKQFNTEFVGDYVNDFVKICIASAVSGVNAIFVGPPGWGKTAICRQAAAKMGGGKNSYSFLRVTPATPEEKLLGPDNPAKMLQGIMERVTEGTPYDSRVKFGILDEAMRGSDFFYDAALDTLDRQDVEDRRDAPPVWLTANFIATGERVQALIDRVGLWFWIKPGMVEVTPIAEAHLANGGSPKLDTSKLPTPEEIERIKYATPGPKAITAVVNALEGLTAEAINEGKYPHPRRVAQWSHLLFTYTAYLTGDLDFDTIPAEAMEIMAYAWPLVSEQEAAEWATLARSATDPVGAAIAEALNMAFPEFKRVSQIQDGRSRGTESAKLGEISSNAHAMLTAMDVSNDDQPRVKAACDQIDQWFADAVRGANVER